MRSKKLSDDRYMTFYNRPKTPCGGVELENSSGDHAGFLRRLDSLPVSIDRLSGKAGYGARAGCRQLRFFALDDLHSISEQALYDRLLGEFPQWLQAAKIKNIVC